MITNLLNQQKEIQPSKSDKPRVLSKFSKPSEISEPSKLSKANSSSELSRSSKEPNLPCATNNNQSCHHVRRRHVMTTLVIIMGVGAVLSLCLPTPTLSLPQVIQGLTDGSSASSLIVRDFRLSRTVLAVLTGASLGLAGTILQRLMHNDLASPDILGVNAGAALTAMICLLVFRLTGITLVVCAIFGGCITMALIIVLSQFIGGRHILQKGLSLQIVIVGVGCNIALYGLINLITAYAATPNIGEALVWLAGSLNKAIWWKALSLTAVLIICGFLLAAQKKKLEILELSYDHATTLGLHVSKATLLLLITCVALTASAAALCGPVAFVGFGAGPLARIFLKGRSSLFVSALMGAQLVLWADLVGQIIPSGPYPVGVLTAGLGGPLLLWILMKQSREVR